MRIGLISDTHGHLDPQVPRLFEGIDHILHAGDVGPWSIVHALEQIAPVTAVLGNNDSDPALRETELVMLDGRKFLVHHIVDPQGPAAGIAARIARENPDAVIFGHTHKPFAEQRGPTLYLNPGYAGRPRFQLERSVALLTCDESPLKYEFRTL